MRQIILILSLLLFFTGTVDAKVKQKATKKRTQTVADQKEPTSPQVTEAQLKGIAKEFYKKAVAGDADAQFELASCFIDGGAKLNYHDGFYWAKRSAEQNHPGGAYYMGFCYSNGLYVTKNATKAKEWYTRAHSFAFPLADTGDPIAQYVIGMLYDNGVGDVYMNKETAVEWYRKSAKQDYARAQINLGFCYDEGEGVDQDHKQAAQLYRKAAEQGHAMAQDNLGNSYYEGEGVKQDYNQAVYWYRKAAEQDYANAQCNLGFCYDEGKGVKQDYEQAVYWYRKAVEQDDDQAQNNLASCYEEGLGVQKNLNKAIELFRKAARQDNEDAQENLERLGYSW